MAAMVPVAPNGTGTSVQPVQHVGQNGMSAEQQMLDYIMRFQAEGLAKGQNLANPSAISGEALKSLKGYFERANALQDRATGKVQKMSESAEGKVETGQLPALPGGPARERLEPAVQRTDVPAQRVEAVSDSELSRLVEVLVETTRFSMDTALITAAGNNIGKSATTLTRGQ